MDLCAKTKALKFQYAAKYATIQNAYKNGRVKCLGLTGTDAVGKKKNFEALLSEAW
jgi:hypothetical protein